MKKLLVCMVIVLGCISHFLPGMGSRWKPCWPCRWFYHAARPTLNEWYETIAKAPESPRNPVDALVESEVLVDALDEFIDFHWHLGIPWQRCINPQPGKYPSDTIANNARGTGYSDDWGYMRRLTLKPGDRVILIGDLHGSIHSLMRLLRYLQKTKLLYDSFMLAANVYMVFMGDYVDRGWYGAECWYTLLTLKDANREQVILLRGNHEDAAMNKKFSYGSMPSFYQELQHKYPAVAFFDPESERVWNRVQKAYRLLPVALFVGCGGSYVQCCHGGLDPRVSPAALLAAPRDGVQLINYQAFNLDAMELGFMWCDFVQPDIDGLEVWHMRGWCFSVRGVERYLAGEEPVGLVNLRMDRSFCTAHDFNTEGRLRGIMRGHQDMHAGVKLLFGSEVPGVERFAQRDAGGWDGPKPWYDVFAEVMGCYGQTLLFKNIAPDGFAPVFTFSNATETQQVDCPAMGILTVQEKFEDWTLDAVFLPNSPLCPQ